MKKLRWDFPFSRWVAYTLLSKTLNLATAPCKQGHHWMESDGEHTHADGYTHPSVLLWLWSRSLPCSGQQKWSPCRLDQAATIVGSHCCFCLEPWSTVGWKKSPACGQAPQYSSYTPELPGGVLVTSPGTEGSGQHSCSVHPTVRASQGSLAMHCHWTSRVQEKSISLWKDPNIPHANAAEVPWNMVTSLGMSRKSGV